MDSSSDAGASPSLSGSDSTSRSSSPELMIDCDESFKTSKSLKAQKGNNSEKIHSGVTGDVETIRRCKYPKVTSTPKKRKMPRRKVSENSNRKKRRRTKSERNSLVRKKSPGTKIDIPSELGAYNEFDKCLDEKALKNNMTATNVRSLINHVAKDGLVQKFVQKANTEEKSGSGSDDEYGIIEPKLTRAKAKELLQKQAPIWHMVHSPAKTPRKLTETELLMAQELPEDSSGDEEYVPKPGDFHHSDDESISSVASLPSDLGSPSVPPRSRMVYKTRHVQQLNSEDSNTFKTPIPMSVTPRPPDMAVGMRTRSKLPLKDKALEELEMQLIPPDITTDMYDWGASDNEDYLDFLKGFLWPGSKNADDEDDAADPEYNIMEDEEDINDKEELRRDRAVKVTKKELNELVAELYREFQFSSGDEVEDLESSLVRKSETETPKPSKPPCQDSVNLVKEFATTSSSVELPVLTTVKNTDEAKAGGSSHTNASASANKSVPDSCTSESAASHSNSKPATSNSNEPTELECSSTKEKEASTSTANTAQASGDSVDASANDCADIDVDSGSCFSNGDLISQTTREIIQDQMRKHIQLTTQAFVLTAWSKNNPEAEKIARTSRKIILELMGFSRIYSNGSCFNVCNLEHAYSLVLNWPEKQPAASPIKKKILHDNFSSNSDKHFQRPIVKLVAESPAFPYPSLLPLNPCLTSTSTSEKKNMFFTKSEDLLLVYGLNELHKHDLSTPEKSKVISQILLPARSPTCVYNRIKNICKTNTKSPDLAKLIKEKKYPPSIVKYEKWKTKYARAPMFKHRMALPNLWRRLIDRLIYSDYRRPKSECALERHAKNKMIKDTEESETALTPQPQQEILESTIPIGQFIIDDQLKRCPDLHAVPINDCAGVVGAYYLVPRALMPDPASLAPNPKTKHRDIEALVRQSIQKEIDGNLEVTAVGSPFSIPAFQNSESEWIDVESLDSPLKRSIISRATSHTSEQGMPDLIENISENAKTPGHSSSSYPQCAKGELSHNICAEESSDDGTYESVDEWELANPDKVVNVVEESSCESELIEVGGSDVLSYTEQVSPVEVKNTECDYEAKSIFMTKDKDEVDGRINKCNNGDGDDPTSGGKGKTQPQPGSSKGYFDAKSQGSSSSIKRITNKSGGGGDEEDDKNDRNPRKSMKLDELEENSQKEEDTDEEVDVESPIKNPKEGSSPVSKKRDKSVAGGNAKKSKEKPHKKPRKKNLSKYNVKSVEQLIQDSTSELDEEVQEAFVDAFLAKVQSTVERTNPGLYASFIQILCEFGKDLNVEKQSELFENVKSLLKDFPDLIVEFGALMKIETNVSGNEVDIEAFRMQKELENEQEFIKLFDTWTEHCPSLKAKVMAKLKVLKDNPATVERDIEELLEPFFRSNPLIHDRFKTMVRKYPSPPQSKDFEVVDIDLNDSTEDLEKNNSESIKLTEEGPLPGTSTCPCDCHLNKASLSYTSRSNHCNKCTVKYQDGKMFMHNGRLMRPLNVDGAPIGQYGRMTDGNSCLECIVKSPSPKKVEKSPAKLAEPAHLDHKTPPFKQDVVEKPKDNKEDGGRGKQVPATSGENADKVNVTASVKKQLPSSSASKSKSTLEVKKEDKSKSEPWTKDEDKILIMTCKDEESIENAVNKACILLEKRSYEEIAARIELLVSILKGGQ